MNNSINLSAIRRTKLIGKIISIKGDYIEAEYPLASIGELVEIESAASTIKAQVMGFINNKVLLCPYQSTTGLSPGARVSSCLKEERLFIPKNILGALTDPYGQIIVEGTGDIENFRGDYPIEPKKRELTSRQPISEALWTGVRAIDTFTTIGKGQRLLLLAEPGVGKSSLLLNLCRTIKADLVIVALIGERSREVIEFHKDLKESGGDKRTIVVASTSDTTPLLKKRAATTAIRLAEIASNLGLDVFLAFDSLTRYVRALRDIGLNSGQFPVRRGYPASVFEEIPKYIERAGNFNTGSITSVYTMLSSGELEEDPLVEEVKGITDGHLILTKKLAEDSHFPALDISKSLSRVGNRFYNKNNSTVIGDIRKIWTNLNEQRELLILGGLVSEHKEVSAKLSLIKSYLSRANCQVESIEDVLVDATKLLKEISALS